MESQHTHLTSHQTELWWIGKKFQFGPGRGFLPSQQTIRSKLKYAEIGWTHWPGGGIQK